MSTMHTGGVNPYSGNEGVVEERTSVTAIIGLVFSLICCVPLFGVIGAMLGVTALVFIAKEGGRLAGRGIAIAAVAVGILMTFAWVLFLVVVMTAFGKMHDELVVPVDKLMQSVEANDLTAVKAGITGTSSQKLTQADLDAFRAAYSKELGKYKSAPSGAWDAVQQWMALSQQMQRYQGNTQGVLPMPFLFDKGPALVVVVVDRTSNPAATGTFSFSNIQIVTRLNSTITLYDPDNRPIPPEVKSPDAPTPPAPPAKPEAKPEGTPPPPK
ncbi:MAG: DUF4190 domain-containing protein [Planctomycetes bacterium]|nr:DUF4190 domain-containing protein [Planctomycetota bacterium]